MLALRFEDFEDKNGKNFIILCKQKNQKKRLTISEELYNEVMILKNMKVNNKKYEVRSYTTPTGKLITNHFVFDPTRSKLILKNLKICKINSRSQIKTKKYKNVVHLK